MADVRVEETEKREAPAYLVPPIIAKALISIQRELQPMTKSASNSAFNSKYVPLEEVTKLAHELLSAKKIGVIQSPITDTDGHAALETILVYEDGRSFSRTTKLAMSKVDPQAHGSAITYTRRYALMAMVGLTAFGEDDDGNKATGVVVPVSDEDKDRIGSLLTHLKFTPEQKAAELFKIKTHDHALLAITNFERLVSMKVRDNEAKANATEAESAATKIQVGTGAIESTEELDMTSEAGFKRRLKALKLAGPTYEKKVIAVATKVPFLSKVMEKSDRVEALDNFLKALESGVHRLEAEFYAPSDENIIVEENVA